MKRQRAKRHTQQEKRSEHARYSSIYAPTNIHMPPALFANTPLVAHWPATTPDINPVYADGSYLPETNSSGWAVYDPTTHKVYYGGTAHTFAQSPTGAETHAILGACTFFPHRRVGTDAQQCISTHRTITQDVNTNFVHLENSEAWREIWRIAGAPLQLFHTPAHTGITGNEIADIFAHLGARLQAPECKHVTLTAHVAAQIGNIASSTPQRTALASAQLCTAAAPLRFDQTAPPPRAAPDHAPTQEEMTDALRRLATHSAPGTDCISGAILKQDTCRKALFDLLTTVWVTRTIPVAWGEAMLIGIPKPNDTVTRGIALTQTALKVLLTIIKNRTPLPLLPLQYGFTARRGTSQPTFHVRNITSTRAATGKQTHCLFVDLTKAFDAIRRDTLGTALRQYGFSETAVSILEQVYAVDRLHLYIDNERISPPIAPNRGVRQGCIASPSVFNIVVDIAMRLTLLDHPNLCGSDVDLGTIAIAYADDIVLLAANDDELSACATTLLGHLANFGLHVNAKKTHVMRFSPIAPPAADTTTSYDSRTTSLGCNKNHTTNTASSKARTPQGTIPDENSTVVIIHHTSDPNRHLGCPVDSCPYVALRGTAKPAPDKLKCHCVRNHFQTATVQIREQLFAPASGHISSTRTAQTAKEMEEATPHFLPPLTCGTHTFSAVTQFHYLGSILQCDTTTTAELAARVRGTRTAFGRLRRSALQDDILPITRQCYLYRMYVIPVATFGMETWAQSAGQITTLQAVLARQCRTILRLWPLFPTPPGWTPEEANRGRRWLRMAAQAAGHHIYQQMCSNDEVLARARIPPLEQTLSNRRLRLYAHVQRENPTAPHIPPITRFRHSRRPSWHKAVAAAMQRRNLSLLDRFQHAKWKAATKDATGAT